MILGSVVLNLLSAESGGGGTQERRARGAIPLVARCFRAVGHGRGRVVSNGFMTGAAAGFVVYAGGLHFDFSYGP